MEFCLDLVLLNNQLKLIKMKLKKTIIKKLMLASVFSISLNISHAQTGAAFSFDGIDDYAAAVHDPTLNVSQFTIETWLKWGASGTALNFITSKGTEVMEIHTGGPVNNNIRFIPTTGVYLDGGLNTITPGTWVHLACVYNPNATLAKMYVNGANVTYSLSGPNSLTTAVVSNTTALHLGTRPGVGFFLNGQLDEFRIWNTARTQCEINTYMNCEIPSTAPGLLVNYHFNQGVAAASNTAVTTITNAALPVVTSTLQNTSLTSTVSNWVAPGGVVSGFTVPLAPISYTATNVTSCSGKTITLNAVGATTVAWSGGVVNNVPFVPIASNGYTMTGSNSITTCSNTAVASVTVNATPTIVVNNGAVCAGKSFTLSASGANTYTYSSGPVVSPITTSSYSVTGTSAAGCLGSNTAVSTVSVNPLPTVSVNSGAICSGGSFTLLASGANTYTYSSGPVVSPIITSSYSVTGTSAAGCLSSNTAVSTITANPLPTINVLTTNTVLCLGENATLTANGASSYTFNPGGSGSNITISPSVTSIYTVTGKDSNGCMNTSIITQNVSPCTDIAALNNSISGAVAMYPNPNNGEFSIASHVDVELSIINELGQVVKLISLNESNTRLVSISQLATGIYFVIGSSDNQIIKQKIIVSK